VESLWMLWAVTGGAISMAIMIKIWLPDPPPPFLAKFITVIVAGVVGGILGGLGFGSHGSDPMPNVNGWMRSDPMPSLIGAIAVSTIFAGVAAFLFASRARNTR
jgi:hypothetical protein